MNQKVLQKHVTFSHTGITLAILLFLGVVASKFPKVLTTDTVRFLYHKNWLEMGFWSALSISSISLKWTIQSQESRFYKLLHLITLLLALSIFPLPMFNSSFMDGHFTIGIDWLVIDFLITAVIFTPLELFKPLNPFQIKFHESWKLDLTYFVVFDLSIKFIVFAIKFPAEHFLNSPKLSDLHTFVQSAPFLIQLISALFIADLAKYLRHSAAHRIPFLWKFHSIHHSTEQIDWMAGSRSHLLDLILDRSFIYGAIYLLGFSNTVFMGYTTIVALQSVWAHSNSHINLGWLKYVIVTPQYHHWHHSKLKEAHDKNFAVHFPVIDMIFGTYYGFKHGFAKETGINDPEFPQFGYIKQFLYPFKRAKIKQDVNESH